MKKMNDRAEKSILVSGASGIVGYGVLRSLRKSEKKLHLIGTSIYNDSVADAFCDVFEQAPLTTDAKYKEWLLLMIKKHSIDFIIPGIEADLYKWAAHIAEIENTGAKVLMNAPELILLCKDKWLFYESLSKIDSPQVIESSLSSDFDFLVQNFGLPFLLKPRSGFGSKGIVRVDNLEIFLKHAYQIGSVLMAQPIMGDESEEFTTSAFCDGSGSFYAQMTLRRKLSKDGYTEKAETIVLD
jgi:carbamoyl-phosphate synthase large subunit